MQAANLVAGFGHPGWVVLAEERASAAEIEKACGAVPIDAETARLALILGREWNDPLLEGIGRVFFEITGESPYPAAAAA